MLISIKQNIIARVDKATRDGRVYIFLTISGAYFCALIFVLFIISLSYANSLAYLCSFLFLSVVWVSCIVTNYNLYGLELSRVESEDYYIEGEEIPLSVRFKNSGEKTRFDVEVSFKDATSGFVLESKPGESHELVINLPFKKSGVYHVKKAQLQTSFPFGIFNSWKPFSIQKDIYLIPKPVPLPLPAYGTSLEAEGLLRTSLQREEFKEHKKYSNPELNRIDWKVYARRGELLQKEFDSSLVKSFEFNEDLVPGEDLKTKLSHLSYWVLEAHKQGAFYSLRVEGQSLANNSGGAHMVNCLKALATRGKDA